MQKRFLGPLAHVCCAFFLSSCVNTAPIIQPLIVTQNGDRARVVQPGSIVEINTAISDRENDDVRLAWYTNRGQLNSNGLPRTSWVLGSQPGVHTILLTATDEHGAQSVARAQVTIGNQYTYEGVVVDAEGKPIDGATVTVNGVSTTTTADGSFRLQLPPEAVNRDHFVIDIRKAGVMGVSQVSTSPPGQSRWTVGDMRTVQRNTNAQFSAADTGSGCRAPVSSLIDWSLYPELSTPKVQNSQGLYVDASLGHPLADALRYVLGGADCNFGANVTFPANSIVDPATGNQPATVDVAIGTVDLNAPSSMPGDYGIDGGGYMVSMGAAEISVSANGNPMQIKDGQKAVLSVPVPRRLRCVDSEKGEDSLDCPPVPQQISLLVYDETQQKWKEDGVAYYDRSKQSYIAELSHLSTYNMDLVKTDPGCLAVNSTAINGPYALDVIVPNAAAGVFDPTYMHREIDNPPGDQSHAFINLPPDTDLGLVAMRKQPDAACPGQDEITPIGIFVGRTGPSVAGGWPPNAQLNAPFLECGPQSVLRDLASTTQIVRDATGIRVGAHSAVFYTLADPATGEILPLNGSNQCSFHAGGSMACSAIGILDPGSVLLRMQVTSPNRLTDTAYGARDVDLFGVVDGQRADVRLNPLSARVGGVIPEDGTGGTNPARVQADNMIVDVPGALDLTLIGTQIISEIVYHVDYRSILTSADVPEITGLSGVATVNLYEPGEAGIPQGDINLLSAVFAAGTQPPKYMLRDLEFVNGCSRMTGQPTPDPMDSYQFQFDTGSTVTVVNNRAAAKLGLQKDAGGNHTGAYNCFDTFPASDQKGYEIDRLVFTGENGTFRVNNPIICWDDDGSHVSGVAFTRSIDGLVGSNMFFDVEIVVDGPTGRIGVIQ